jgi:hypothetical protein
MYRKFDVTGIFCLHSTFFEEVNTAYGDFSVSSCLGARVDAISQRRNDFLTVASLSSLTDVPRHHFFLRGIAFNENRNWHLLPLGLP